MLNQEYLGVANQLRAWCPKHHHKDYYLLKSIPGIGGYLSEAILVNWEISDGSIMNDNSKITLAWSLEFIKVISPAEK